MQTLDAYKTDALLGSYVDRYSDALVRRRADVAARAAKVEAELAYKARGEFLAHMNHELRTPLNAIIGFATMMKDGHSYGLREEQTAEYLDYILQSADLLLSHINTLLEIAAAESGGAKISRQGVTVRELLEFAVEKVSSEVTQAKITISVNIAPDLPEIWVDPDKIGIAIQRLLENAFIYCNAGSQITILAQKGRRTGQKDWVYIAVKDNGIGMAPEELDRSLRVFEHIHKGLQRNYEGAGIGLPIAKSFIELNGGKFDVKSRKGIGTTVRIALPAKQPAAQDESTTEGRGAYAYSSVAPRKAVG